MIVPGASANDCRPTSTVTGRLCPNVAPEMSAPTACASSIATLPIGAVPPSPNMARTTSAASPGRTRNEWVANGVRPVDRGDSSTSVAPSWTTAWRSRR